MKKSRLIFGATSTQPVGTSDDEMEHVYQNSYKPFLKALYNAPSVPAVLHFSGQLLTWLERHHSEYTDVLAEMVSRKQVELLGGGFYDPVFSLIPRQDRIGQIESLTTYVRKRFGRRPRGSWVTEHIWEPSLASTLRSSGMEYVFLDDYHFVVAGFTGDDLFRPCLTEDQGKTILVFPVSHELVTACRSGSPKDVVDKLVAGASTDPSKVFVLIDEGERYCTDPNGSGSSQSQWLQEFLGLLEERQEEIEILLPAQISKDLHPGSRGYFPSAAVEELIHVTRSQDRKKAFESLRQRFEDDAHPYVYGGCFRHFLTRYGESNLMYAKMQYTHVLVNQIRGDKYRKQAAREELWRGQCHNAYWHGRHDGIYNNRLRKHVYRALIEAEKRTREKGIFIPSVVTIDFDMDGVDEFLYQGQDLNAYVHQKGGTLFELDYLPKSWNYLDTMGRTPETYHTKEVAARGYDRQMPKSFLDHFIAPELTLGEFERGDYEEQGTFISEFYQRVPIKRDNHLLGLEARGSVKAVASADASASEESARPAKPRQMSVTLSKRYSYKRSAVQVNYVLTSNEQERFSTVFAPEINLGFISSDAKDLRLFVKSGRAQPKEQAPDSSEHSRVSEVRFDDLWNEVQLSVAFSEEVTLWSYPIVTAARNSTGVRDVYQGSALVPRFLVELGPEGSKEFQITLTIDKAQ